MEWHSQVTPATTTTAEQDDNKDAGPPTGRRRWWAAPLPSPVNVLDRKGLVLLSIGVDSLRFTRVGILLQSTLFVGPSSTTRWAPV